jgi:hypothetical protein
MCESSIGDDVGVRVEAVARFAPEPIIAGIRHDTVPAAAATVDDRIVVNRIVDRLPWPERATAAILIDDANTIAESTRRLDQIAIDLDIAAVLDEDLRSPQPIIAAASAVEGYQIVSDDRVV